MSDDAIRSADLVRDAAIHRRIYTDAAVFVEEMQRIFYRRWLVVAHISEIARPGDFKTTHMGRQPVIVCRDEGGRIRVLLNTCRHRGALVCREASGNAQRFNCLYHAWSYRLDGALDGVPGEEAYGPTFRKDQIRLWPVPRVEVYHGLVFAALDENVESLADFLGPARKYIEIALTCGGEAEIVGANPYRYRGNWKLHLDNTIDGYHARYLHRFFSQEAGLFTEGQAIVLGNGHGVLEWETRAPKGETARLLGLDKTETTLPTNRVLVLFPSAVISHVQDLVNLRIAVPLAPEHTEVAALAIGFKGETEAARMRRAIQFSAAQGPAGSAGADDIEAFEASHEGFAATAGDVGWLNIGRGLHRGDDAIGLLDDDTVIRAMYREWRRLMNGDRAR